jgi:hypothetical protein
VMANQMPCRKHSKIKWCVLSQGTSGHFYPLSAHARAQGRVMESSALKCPKGPIPNTDQVSDRFNRGGRS